MTKKFAIIFLACAVFLSLFAGTLENHCRAHTALAKNCAACLVKKSGGQPLAAAANLFFYDFLFSAIIFLCGVFCFCENDSLVKMKIRMNA